MAGAGYKLYATGDVLTAAQVNTYLQEQTVMVFADAAARTTALASVLAEGMISYLKDTDSLQYYTGSAWTNVDTGASPLTTKGDLYGFSTTNARVAVGTNGQVLTADSTAATGLAWATPASGGWTSIASGSLGTAPLTLSSISGSYKDLRLVLRDYSTASSTLMALRCNNDSTASAYNQSGTYQSTTTATTFAGLNSYVLMDYGLNMSSTDYRNALVIDLYDYTNTNSNKLGRYINGFVEQSNANYILEQGVFMWNASTPAAVTRLDLVLGTGNFDGGTYILYGGN